MLSTGHDDKMIELLSGSERRRRRTPQEKIAIVQQTMEHGEARWIFPYKSSNVTAVDVTTSGRDRVRLWVIPPAE